MRGIFCYLFTSSAVFILIDLRCTSHASRYMSAKKMLSVDFEVYGRVQGVFFRKHTQQQAKVLGLKGYCMNTERGTVQGRMEGDEQKIEAMKKWLQEVGSPSSHIEKAVFTDEHEIKSYTNKDFVIRR